MARVALIDLDVSVRTCVDALFPVEELVPAGLDDDFGAVDLVILQLAGNERLDTRVVDRYAARSPVLLVAAPGTQIPSSVYDISRTGVLREPFDLLDMRAKVRGLMHAPGRSAEQESDESPVSSGKSSSEPADGTSPGRQDGFLRYPTVPAAAERFLRAAARLEAPLWLIGEPGTGLQRLAAAWSLGCSPSRRLVVLGRGERPGAVIERESGGEDLALFVRDVEKLSPDDQERLIAELSASPRFRLVATSAEAPIDAVSGGDMSRRLYHLLSPLAFRLPPLRERPRADFERLLSITASNVAVRLGARGARFSPEALARLTVYPWPGNLLELEAVVSRTLCSLIDPEAPAGFTGTVENSALAFLPDWEAASGSAVDVAAARGVVVPLEDAAARQPREPAPAEVRSEELPVAPSAAAVEHLVAGLAHDLRNPLATVQTFAAIRAAGAPDDEAELAELAVAACARMDHHMDVLQTYATFDDPRPANVDLAEMIGESLRDRPGDLGSKISLRLPTVMPVRADPVQLRYVVDTLLDEIDAVLAGVASVVVTATGADDRTVRITVPTGDSAVTHLRKVVAQPEGGLSWRLTLAAAVVARNGGDLKIDSSASQMTVNWRLAADVEVEVDGERADGSDRRRRSGSA